MSISFFFLGLAPFGATQPHTYKFISDISRNKDQISSNFLAINLVYRATSICLKMLKYVTPSSCNPTPHSHIGDISGNYEWISTKFSAIIVY